MENFDWSRGGERTTIGGTELALVFSAVTVAGIVAIALAMFSVCVARSNGFHVGGGILDGIVASP